MSAPTDERTNEKKKTTLNMTANSNRIVKKNNKFQIKTRNKTKRLPSHTPPKTVLVKPLGETKYGFKQRRYEL